MNQLLGMALYHFKASGEFNVAEREWENKLAMDKTWVNIKTFISAEYACKNKQNKLTMKQFKANAMKEQAEAMEELIATLTENHTRQMEALIKSTTEAMKEMMQLVKTQTIALTKATKPQSKRRRKNVTRNKKVQRSTSLHTLWQKASIKERGQMLGTQEKQIISPGELEIVQKNLKVRGVLNRIRDMAARKSDIK
jgi:hypothetical protein